MPKSFYNEYYAFKYDAQGNDLSTETRNAVKDIFKKYFNEGYSPREISHIMQDAIGLMEAEETLRFAFAKRQENKARDYEESKVKNPEFYARLEKRNREDLKDNEQT